MVANAHAIDGTGFRSTSGNRKNFLKGFVQRILEDVTKKRSSAASRGAVVRMAFLGDTNCRREWIKEAVDGVVAWPDGDTSGKDHDFIISDASVVQGSIAYDTMSKDQVHWSVHCELKDQSCVEAAAPPGDSASAAPRGSKRSADEAAERVEAMVRRLRADALEGVGREAELRPSVAPKDVVMEDAAAPGGDQASREENASAPLPPDVGAPVALVKSVASMSPLSPVAVAAPASPVAPAVPAAPVAPVAEAVEAPAAPAASLLSQAAELLLQTAATASQAADEIGKQGEESGADYDSDASPHDTDVASVREGDEGDEGGGGGALDASAAPRGDEPPPPEKTLLRRSGLSVTSLVDRSGDLSTKSQRVQHDNVQALISARDAAINKCGLAWEDFLPIAEQKRCQIARARSQGPDRGRDEEAWRRVVQGKSGLGVELPYLLLRAVGRRAVVEDLLGSRRCVEGGGRHRQRGPCRDRPGAAWCTSIRNASRRPAVGAARRCRIARRTGAGGKGDHPCQVRPRTLA